MNAVNFFNEGLEFKLTNKRKRKYWIITCVESEKKILNEIGFIFCTDDYLLAINQKFLKHKTLTDTITFNYSNKKKSIEGEVFLSIDRVRENCKNYSVSFEEELSRVMIHGVLHLCGYNDKKPKERQKMKRREDQYLNLLL